MKHSQTREILKYLCEGNTLTQRQATELFGTIRLSAIIFELRKHGWPIKTIMITGTDRYGEECKYGMYKMEGKRCLKK